MKIKIIIAIAVALLLTVNSVFSSEEKENMYLIQILNQLDTLKPLVIAASKEQPENLREKFHYIAFKDQNGKSHNGLIEDINELIKGIQEKVRREGEEPHVFQAIKGDYINRHS
jgi:RAQPRD family integrative conjugative element protein